MEESRWAELVAYLILGEHKCLGKECQCQNLRELPAVSEALERFGLGNSDEHC